MIKPQSWPHHPQGSLGKLCWINRVLIHPQITNSDTTHTHTHIHIHSCSAVRVVNGEVNLWVSVHHCDCWNSRVYVMMEQMEAKNKTKKKPKQSVTVCETCGLAHHKGLSRTAPPQIPLRKQHVKAYAETISALPHGERGVMWPRAVWCRLSHLWEWSPWM